jgi:hypothetical protein
MCFRSRPLVFRDGQIRVIPLAPLRLPPMFDWTWTREKVSPSEILDAARTIPVSNNRVTMDLTSRWVPARQYLEWARSALGRGGEDGWDSASSLAKRSVCRQIDGILAHNHLGCFHGHNYEKKSEYLAELKVPALALLRDFVIDPRNDIEHAYRLATGDQARRAMEVAEVFIAATSEEAGTPAIMALGWNVNVSEFMSSTSGKEQHVIKFVLTKNHSPMLLISGYPDAPEATIIHPKEEALRMCPLKEFKSHETIKLNTRLRECLKSTSYTSRSLSEAFTPNDMRISCGPSCWHPHKPSFRFVLRGHIRRPAAADRQQQAGSGRIKPHYHLSTLRRNSRTSFTFASRASQEVTWAASL